MAQEVNLMEVKETAKKYKQHEQLTYADYAGWDDENRYELIDGRAYMMAAPSVAHQRIAREILLQLGSHLRDKPCEVFIAPFDVCLSGRGDDDDTVVQPDIIVICDKAKLDKKRCNGAPDFIIEIVSPSSSSHDRLTKLNKYLLAGVREYWIVDPDDKGVSVHVLENGKYFVSAHESTETINVNVLDGCKIVLPDVFSE